MSEVPLYSTEWLGYRPPPKSIQSELFSLARENEFAVKEHWTRVRLGGWGLGGRASGLRFRGYREFSRFRGYRERLGYRKRLVQGFLAHEKTPTPLEPPWDPMHRPTVGS